MVLGNNKYILFYVFTVNSSSLNLLCRCISCCVAPIFTIRQKVSLYKRLLHGSFLSDKNNINGNSFHKLFPSLFNCVSLCEKIEIKFFVEASFFSFHKGKACVKRSRSNYSLRRRIWVFTKINLVRKDRDQIIRWDVVFEFSQR